MKKAIAMFFALLLVLTSVLTPALAQAPQPNTENSLLRVERCEWCATGLIVNRGTSYGSWITVGTAICPKNPNYTDKLQERSYETLYECNNCGIGYADRGVQTRTYCNH